jgi:hypothetical protein
MQNVGMFYGNLEYFTVIYDMVPIAIWYIVLPFGILYCHLVYCIAIWYIVLPFGIFCGHLVYYLPFWYVVPKNTYGYPCLRVQLRLYPQWTTIFGRISERSANPS